MGGAAIVPQIGGRSYRSPLQEVGGAGVVLQQLAVRPAGRPIVSYGFVGIAFVSVSRLCPYTCVHSAYVLRVCMHVTLGVHVGIVVGGSEVVEVWQSLHTE